MATQTPKPSTAMDSSLSHVIYIHKDVKVQRLIPRSTAAVSAHQNLVQESPVIIESLLPILEYTNVHACSTGASCIATLTSLFDSNYDHLTPFIVLIDTPYDEPIPEARPNRPASPGDTREVSIQTPDEEVYGLKLLQRIMTEAHLRSIAKLVVAIPVISYPNGPMSPFTSSHLEFPSQPISTSEWVDKRLLQRSLDLGATDVIVGPVDQKSVTSLEVHAYRAHRDALREHRAVMEMRRGRKRSWVGVNEEKPYSYLREAMVAGLMKGICRDGNEEAITQAKISVPSDRRDVVAKAIGQWNFSAHSFSDDELLYAGLLMFTHALEMPGMEKWRIGSDQLINYLVACRAAYNNFVPYHNWRHVVDVLQATFSFLVVQGCLPAYSVGAKTLTPRKSPFTALIEPFEAITLLITAIGHDVGHPGVNNGFLVTLNSPLAQLYNDKSVLESFHCAAYSQILRRYWYSAFEDVAMRKLMISSILATDMGLHNDYMKKLADVTALLAENRSTADWTPKMIQDNKALACSLIIKCADICNVAREYSTAVQWMHILSKEFARQAVMEQDLRIPTSLMAPPKNDMQSLCHGQLGFMNLFAIPLFNQVAAIMPQMQFTVDQLAKNKVLFEDFSQIVSAQASAVPEDMSPPVADTEHEEAPEADAVSCMDFDVSATGPPSSAGRDMELRPRTCGRISAPRHQHLIISPAPISPSPISPRQRGLSTTSSQPPDDREISFMSVADFAASDPFGSQTEECHSSGLINPSTQRHSETTEGSNSLPSSSDWASQANSATGKLPLSPSTRGTSINSQSDIQEETPVPDVPVRIVYPEDTATPTPTNLASYSQSPDEHQPASRGNSIGRAEGKTITKRPSRFRLNTFNLFKRHRSPPPVPMPMGDGQSPS